MIRVNVHDAKTHLSRYLAQVEDDGEVVVICRRNQPVAELRPIPRRAKKARVIEAFYGEGWDVPDSFFEPLPDELVDAFEGGLRDR